MYLPKSHDEAGVNETAWLDAGHWKTTCDGVLLPLNPQAKLTILVASVAEQGNESVT